MTPEFEDAVLTRNTQEVSAMVRREVFPGHKTLTEMYEQALKVDPALTVQAWLTLVPDFFPTGVAYWMTPFVRKDAPYVASILTHGLLGPVLQKMAAETYREAYPLSNSGFTIRATKYRRLDDGAWTLEGETTHRVMVHLRPQFDIEEED